MILFWVDGPRVGVVEFRVFVSHSSGEADAPLARKVREGLKRRGMTPYLAEYEREPGRYVHDKIREALDASDVVLALLTRAADASGAVQQEIGGAEAAEKPLIALVEKGIRPTLFLHSIDTIDLDPANPAAGLTEAYEALKALKAAKETKREWLTLGAIVGLGALAYFKKKRDDARDGNASSGQQRPAPPW